MQFNVLCDCQRSKIDQPEVAVPLEDYSVYAGALAHDSNKVIHLCCVNLSQNNLWCIH